MAVLQGEPQWFVGAGCLWDGRDGGQCETGWWRCYRESRSRESRSPWEQGVWDGRDGGQVCDGLVSAYADWGLYSLGLRLFTVAAAGIWLTS